MAELQITIRQAEAANIATLSVLAASTYAHAFGHSMSAEDLATQIRSRRLGREPARHRPLSTLRLHDRRQTRFQGRRTHRRQRPRDEVSAPAPDL